MKPIHFIIAAAAFLILACSGEELLESDFKINPLKQQDAALRSFFFKGDSVAFYEEGRPFVDTGAGRSYGIRWIKGNDGRDSAFGTFANAITMNFGLNSKTPSSVKIKTLYLSFPNNQAYWKFGPQKGATDIKTINMVIPNTLMASTFPVLVGATLEGMARDTANLLKPFLVTVPEDTVYISVK